MVRPPLQSGYCPERHVAMIPPLPQVVLTCATQAQEQIANTPFVLLVPFCG